jgi:hypothetical protein
VLIAQVVGGLSGLTDGLDKGDVMSKQSVTQAARRSALDAKRYCAKNGPEAG